MSIKKPPIVDPDDIQAKWQRIINASGGEVRQAPALKDRLAAEKRDEKKVDGRTLRRTGRTQQVNIRLKQQTKDSIQRIATAQDWLIGEVIEHAVTLLEAHLAAQPRGDGTDET